MRRTFYPGVYAIVHAATGKSYVGSTKDLTGRRCDHLCDLRRGGHDNRKLQVDFDRDGEEEFSWTVLEEVHEPSQLKIREQWWMDNLRVTDDEFGYNINVRADSKLGTYHTPETKEKCRRATQERMNRPGVKEHLARINTGKRATPETKAKLSAKQRGESNRAAKLSETDVAEIRRLLASDETISAIARRFSVNRFTIRRIRDGQGWLNIGVGFPVGKNAPA